MYYGIIAILILQRIVNCDCAILTLTYIAAKIAKDEGGYNRTITNTEDQKCN